MAIKILLVALHKFEYLLVCLGIHQPLTINVSRNRQANLNAINVLDNNCFSDNWYSIKVELRLLLLNWKAMY